MTLRFSPVIGLLIFGLASFSPNLAQGQTRLGLHVTQEELNIWRQRAVSGPYKSAGDVSTNSPGDWTRIQSNADSFLSNPSAERWSGQSSGSCWSSSSTSPALPGRSRGEKLRDAAFYYLITNEIRYRDAVRNELLVQAGTAGTNWVDTGRWRSDSSCTSGDSYSHEITMWLNRILFGYDYIRSTLSASDRTTLDAWFKNAGIFWEKVVANNLEKLFPNRNKNDYTSLGPGWYPDRTVCSYGKCVTHYNGWKKYDWHEGWNNRNAAQIRFVALAGILTNDNFLKDQAKRYFKEWLRYAVFADGTDSDFHRWTDTNPSQGWAYSSGMIGAMVTIADHFARIGDLELYKYTTSDGIGTMTPAGGPKDLKQTILRLLEYVNISLVRYGTDRAENNGNSLYRIGSINLLGKEEWVNDTYIAPANTHYQDAFIKSVYTRKALYAPSYPSSPSNGGYNPWGGEQGIYPGVLFMFGDQEGKVSPYSGSTVIAPPPSASNDPIAYWKFDEDTGAVAKDSSGTGNHATLTNGAAWTTGQAGSAVSLDGVDDFVKIATTNFSTSQGTVALWIKAATFSSNPQNIFGHTSIPFANRIRFYVDDTGGNLDLSLGDSHRRALNIQQLQTNTWYYLTLTWNSGTYTVYVDGIQKSTGYYSGLDSLNSYAHIGGGGDDSKPMSWNGVIDEVKIWNRALTATEVQNEYSSYSSLLPASPSGLVIQTVVP